VDRDEPLDLELCHGAVMSPVRACSQFAILYLVPVATISADLCKPQRGGEPISAETRRR